jgi:hypothetical protein
MEGFEGDQALMTFEQFDKFQEELLAEVVKMKSTKGREYANSADRFGNFNRLSQRLELPNYKIGWIYLVKHLDSIEAWMKDPSKPLTESIQGRFVDAITYLTLIAGMVVESQDRTL